jgi:hypothetical protein
VLCNSQVLTLQQVETGRRRPSSASERAPIFRVDIARCGSRALSRHHGYRHAYVQKHSSMAPTQDEVGTAR